MLDLVDRGGEVVDGTGRPRRRADNPSALHGVTTVVAGACRFTITPNRF
ncbi:MAG TPA: hypothetical protein VLX59_15150 [Acidimicrobiales bacterium]|nr:hypothetical protein [Acidimicrobiales bacterium]